MSGGRRSRGRVAALRRDLAGIQAFEELYPLPTGPTAPSAVSPLPVATDVERDASTIQGHELGPHHCGRFVEVFRPQQVVNREGRPVAGEYRPAGPICGRLIGYQPAIVNRGPNTGTPTKSFELLLQQGPHITTAVVSWADPIRIA